MKQCKNCGECGENEARFCQYCGMEFNTNQCGMNNMEERNPIGENGRWVRCGDKKIRKITVLIAVVLILVISIVVYRKSYSIEGTYYNEWNEEVMLKNGVFYYGGEPLCSYDYSGGNLRFYTDDGIYYGTYIREEKAFYVDGETYKKR